MTRFFGFLVLVFSSSLLFAQTIPEHGGVWVHDEAHVLSATTIAELEYILKAERDSTSNQIAILIIPSLDGGSIDDYSIKVAEKWKIGTKKNDNGVLFVVAIQDKKVRIEVGNGLEGVLTDAMSHRINRNEVNPHFRQGDYDGGIRAGVNAIIQTIRGEYVNTDPPLTKRKGRSPWSTLIFIIIIIIAAARGRKGGGGRGGMGMWVAGSMLGSGFGRSSGSWGSGGGGSDYGGGGGFGGGGSSDSW